MMKTIVFTLIVLVGIKISTGFPTTSIYPWISKTSNKHQTAQTTSDDFEEGTIINQIDSCHSLNSLEAPDYCPECPDISGHKVQLSTDFSTWSFLDYSISVESMEITNLCEIVLPESL